jgi:multimeric flavodoxin WrbA
MFRTKTLQTTPDLDKTNKEEKTIYDREVCEIKSSTIPTKNTVRKEIPMKAILLDGSQANDNAGQRICTSLTAELQNQGWEVEHINLSEKKIGNCAGDFFCWIRTPGICNVADDNRAIAEALVASDLIVYLTPVMFGGYCSTLKRMVDHQIQLVSPYFIKVAGETHHQKRYTNNPNLLVIGWMESPDPQSEAVFRHLVQRNALNWHANTYVSGVVLASESDQEIQATVQKWLNDLQSCQSSQRIELLKNVNPTTTLGTVVSNGAVEVQRALLLVGSPKTRKSTSNSLGGYLFEHLSAQSIQTETIYLHTVLRSPAKMKALLDAVDAADLLLLAFPLYVDTLPAPVIEALERIAEHRHEREQTRQQLFGVIANCGFPESHQCDTALSICKIFAYQANFEWAGALALGGGEGIVGGIPLAELDGRAIPIRKSLELAAEALALGRVIPVEAQDILAKPVVPNWVYRLMSSLGWKQRAKRYGAQKSLRRKPYTNQLTANHTTLKPIPFKKLLKLRMTN